MSQPVDDALRLRAKTPHELSMINLLLFNLLLLIALLAGSFLPQGSVLLAYRWWLPSLPLLLSLGVVLYTWRRARAESAQRSGFIAAHWRLAAARNRILLLAYLVGGGLIGLGWLLSLSQSDPRMEALMFVALQRVAVAPVLIALMVLIMLESGAIYLAGQGKLPASASEAHRQPV